MNTAVAATQAPFTTALSLAVAQGEREASSTGRIIRLGEGELAATMARDLDNLRLSMISAARDLAQRSARWASDLVEGSNPYGTPDGGSAHVLACMQTEYKAKRDMLRVLIQQVYGQEARRVYIEALEDVFGDAKRIAEQEAAKKVSQ